MHTTEIDLAEQPEHAGAVVEHRLDLVDTHLGRAPEVEHHAGVEITGAGAHHQALQRRETHCRVHRAPAGDRSRRRAVARCSTIWFSDSSGCPRNIAACWLTY